MTMRTTLTALPLALLLAACGSDPLDLTLGEIDTMTPEERVATMEQLGGENAQLLMLGAMNLGLTTDTNAAKRMTVGEVIELGRKARDDKREEMK